MFRYLILVTLFFILFFTVSWIYGHFIAESVTDVSFTYTKVSNGDFWDITINFDGRTETTSKRKGGGISGFPVYGDESQYTVNVDGNGDVFGVRKYLPKDHRHADDGSVLGENDDQATVPRSTPIRSPESSPDASSDPSPESSPDASSDPTPVVNITPGPGNASTKAVAAPAPTNVLKITRVSHDEVVGRGGLRSNMVLTVELTASAPDTQHNLLVITVNGHNFGTPIDFFGTALLNTDDRRTVELQERLNNNAVYMKVLDPRNFAWLSNNRAGWETIRHFDETRFTISVSDTSGIRDSVTQMHFDTNGNRIEIAPAAPSIVRKKYGVWAALKRRNR